MSPEGEYTRADLERYLSRVLPELEATADIYTITHTVQVTSFGGSGTTALCAHLLEAGVDLQPGPAQWPFKHQRRPPTAEEVPEGFRVLYVIGEPRDAVLSIFRREYQIGHYRSLNGMQPDADTVRRLESLETFLAAGVDDFSLADHLEGWLDHPAGYPVLFVRYEWLSEAWSEIAEFIGLPADSPPLPARGRRSNRLAISAPMQEQLDALYGAFARRIEALPPTLVV